MNSSVPTVVVTRKRVACFVALGYAVPAGIAVSLLIALGQSERIIPVLSVLAIPCGVFWLMLSTITPSGSAAITPKESASLKWWEIAGMFGFIFVLPIVAFALPKVLYVPSSVVFFLATMYVVSLPRVQGRLNQLRGQAGIGGQIRR